MAEAALICSVCGFRNKPNDARCNSCGAKLLPEMLVEQDDSGKSRGGAFAGFRWKWGFIALCLYLGLAGLVLILLPAVISSFDPQGLPGLAIAAASLLVGGLIVGRVSPRHVLMEPTAAAIVAIIPMVFYIGSISDHGQMSQLAYIVMIIMCVLLAFMGAFIGDRLQSRG